MLHQLFVDGALGYAVKPVLLGPLAYLWLGKSQEVEFDRLTLLSRLLPIYEQLLTKISTFGVEWVQIDEPILGLDLPISWKIAFYLTYEQLSTIFKPSILLTAYFGGLKPILK